MRYSMDEKGREDRFSTVSRRTLLRMLYQMKSTLMIFLDRHQGDAEKTKLLRKNKFAIPSKQTDGMPARREVDYRIESQEGSKPQLNTLPTISSQPTDSERIHHPEF